jgi:glutaredoxin-related protein
LKYIDADLNDIIEIDCFSNLPNLIDLSLKLNGSFNLDIHLILELNSPKLEFLDTSRSNIKDIKFIQPSPLIHLIKEDEGCWIRGEDASTLWEQRVFERQQKREKEKFGLKDKPAKPRTNNLPPITVPSKLTTDYLSLLTRDDEDLDLSHLELEGTLIIDGWKKLKSLNVGNNQLSQTNFLNSINSKNLNYLSIHSNKFEKKQDLEIFSKFDNLKELYINNNNFFGSLDPLVSMNDLRELNISKVDIDSGLEYLPSSLEKIYCYHNKFKEQDIKEFSLLCGTEKSEKGTYYNYQNWRKSKLSEVLPKLARNSRWFLDNYYPKEEREEIKELNISEKDLEGRLCLEGFGNLVYLICCNNNLENIDLSNCPNLTSIDCRSNKLKKIIFKDKLNLEDFQASNNEFTDIKNILSNINHKSLTYLDISNNKIADADINNFNDFTKLKSLFVQKNKNLSGSLESLISFEELFDINITGTNIEIFRSSKKTKNLLPKRIEEIYSDKSADKEFILKNYYNQERKFYDIKAWRDRKQRKFRIETIVKVPLLSNGKNRSEINKTNENYNYNSEKIVYDKIYPTDSGFSWEVGDRPPRSWLPTRLCYMNKKNESNTDNEIIISVEKRGNYKDSSVNYAILSYFWGDKINKNKEWKAVKINGGGVVSSLGGRKSLIKVTKALEVINKELNKKNKNSEVRDENIDYFWIDQLCINQNNPKEKASEILNMRHYYGNSAVTLIAIHDKIGEELLGKWKKSFKKGETKLIYPNKIIESSLPILEKIIGSDWFSRSWTFQEGLLSKQTVFMFDDCLIDGRFMALIWKLRQASVSYYDECEDISSLCEKKVSTPVGWAYYKGERDDGKENYNIRDKVSLGLNEALWAVRKRSRSIPLDGIYSILGLLPYGREVEVDYEKDLESVLREVMLIAIKNGYGEPLSWHGTGSRTPGLCWIPEINNETGSSSVLGTININCEEKRSFFEPNLGIEINCSEYEIISIEKDSGIYSFDKEGIVDGNLWMRKIWVELNEKGSSLSKNEKLTKLTLSGTKEGIKSIREGRVIIIPNKEEWKSNIPFAILALKVENNSIEESLKKLKKEKNFIRHRIDLLRIEEGYENLNQKGKDAFIIGLNNQADNQQYHAQVEINYKIKG